MISLNKLILEPYTGKGKIEAEVKSGFASVKQKTNLVGLKVLSDAKIFIGNNAIDIKYGQVVYFKEEILHNNDWAKQTYKSDFIENAFIIAESNSVILIK